MVYRRRYLSGQSATTALIAEKAVTEDKIADKAVGEAQLADDAVSTGKIQDGEVKSEDIGSKEVKTPDIDDGAVTTPKIANGAVTSEKLADPVITRPITPGVATAEIANEAVTEGKLGAGAATETKIGAGSVVAIKLAGDAVETAKIKDDAVTQPKIAAGAVGNTEIAADAVRGTEIQDGAVSEGKIGTDAVTTVKIKDDNVTTPKILDANVTEPKLERDILSKKLYNRQIFYDDFVGSVLDTKWRVNGDAGGVASVQPSSIGRIVTDNDIGDFYRLDWNGVHGMAMDAGIGRAIFRVKPLSVADVVVFIGIYKGAADFVGFRLDTSVDGNWYAVSKVGGVETATDTGVAAAAGFQKFEVLYLSVGGDIEFRIDNALVATINANQFDDIGHVCLKIETLANAAKTLDIDLALVALDRAIA